MLNKIKSLIIISGITFLTACGFHFQNEQQLPAELQTLSLQSSDPYNDITRITRNQLLLQNVNLVDSQPNVPTLRINKTTTDSSVASVFKQGRKAENILTLNVEASLTIPNKGTYPIDVRLNRTFFDNSRAALAKSNEQEVIRNDMYKQAARQLILKMTTLHNQINQ